MMDAPAACQVQLRNKPAGHRANAWNEGEKVLFQTTMAFVMRQHLKQEFSLSNILVCNETAPVSLWFVVTSPLDPTLLVDKEDVAAAVRKFRHRINCVFLLTDLTLEFVDLYPTLAEPAKLRLSVYLVVFLVMMSVIGAVMVVLFVSTVRELKCKKKQEADKGEEQQRVKKVENGSTSEDVHDTMF
ncbi:collectrin isoform X2 [Nothobranchius furzeri]|uniref:collectrin isoform X2 n=1 Tax=Nothobranchius furzeri TaxID=105023 RepID=UPI003904A0FF